MSDVGRAHWERLWSAPWILVGYDVAAVTRLCELYEDREAMRASIREWGLMLPASKAAGGGRSNPMIDKLMKVESELRKLEVEFGLTPAARAKLGLTEVSRVSKLDEMMRRQKEA
jgi:P27 family predicted phage terminase small subunit